VAERSPEWVDAIGQIFSVIPDLATPDQVESSLREILRDPELELYWWDWEGERYVDVHARVRELPAMEGARAVTLVGYETRKVGAVAHEARLLDQPEFLGSFVPTIRIAMERDRLHRDLLRKLEELKASRLRIVTAGDAERRRLERNLHDGAQQRLVTALLGLRRLEQAVAGRPELEDPVQAARRELEGAIEELRELSRGLHPPLLARRGLAAAIRAASARSAVPIELDLDIPDELPPAIEAAAYYVCAEAVTNTIKHARASQVWLTIARENGALRVDVRDDGVGGACIDCEGEASGLGGLLDRVETLDGTLEVVSPEGEGTRLVATFPVGGSASTS
jgi:signal transduction histidine kinase